ncbi:MAG: hypothetical protein V8Q82_06665 [Christensenellales bacterium]
MGRFGLTEVQAQAILDMRLQRLTGLEILALRKEYAEVLQAHRRAGGDPERKEADERHQEGARAWPMRSTATSAAPPFCARRRFPSRRRPHLETPVPEDECGPDTRGGQLRRMAGSAHL